MYAPRVFISMIFALAAFAGATYWMTGSAYTTVLQTIICAVILQVGYFIGLLYLVHREKTERQRAGNDPLSNTRTTEVRSADTISVEPATPLNIPDR